MFVAAEGLRFLLGASLEFACSSYVGFLCFDAFIISDWSLFVSFCGPGFCSTHRPAGLRRGWEGNRGHVGLHWSTGERGSVGHPALYWRSVWDDMVTNTHEWLMRDAREGGEHECSRNYLSKKTVENEAWSDVLCIKIRFLWIMEWGHSWVHSLINHRWIHLLSTLFWPTPMSFLLLSKGHGIPVQLPTFWGPCGQNNL